MYLGNGLHKCVANRIPTIEHLSWILRRELWLSVPNGKFSSGGFTCTSFECGACTFQDDVIFPFFEFRGCMRRCRIVPFHLLNK